MPLCACQATDGRCVGLQQPAFFNGYIAQVGIFSRAIDKSEVRNTSRAGGCRSSRRWRQMVLTHASLCLQMSCLYKYGETHLGLPPPDSGL